MNKKEIRSLIDSFCAKGNLKNLDFNDLLNNADNPHDLTNVIYDFVTQADYEECYNSDVKDIFSNKTLPFHIYLFIIDNIDDEVYEDISSYYPHSFKNFNEDQMKTILEKNIPDVTITLLSNSIFPKKLIDEVMASTKIKDNLKIALIHNPNTPIKYFYELANNLSYYTGLAVNTGECYVAENSRTPVDLLIKISKSSNLSSRLYVARNPNTPIETLKELSKDKYSNVRTVVAELSRTPIEILVELSKDQDEYVRREVAKNRNTPVEVLIELSKDKYEYVRKAAFNNNNLPKDIKDAAINKIKASIENFEDKVAGKIPVTKEDLKILVDSWGRNSNMYFKNEIPAAGQIDLSKLDVSQITDMNQLFMNSKFNGDISNWDVSNVTNMGQMFFFSQFNKPLNWDTSNVTNMAGMFGYSKFAQMLNFNVDKVVYYQGMFEKAFDFYNKFNQRYPISDANGGSKLWLMTNMPYSESKFKKSRNIKEEDNFSIDR